MTTTTAPAFVVAPALPTYTYRGCTYYTVATPFCVLHWRLYRAYVQAKPGRERSLAQNAMACHDNACPQCRARIDEIQPAEYQQPTNRPKTPLCAEQMRLVTVWIEAPTAGLIENAYQDVKDHVEECGQCRRHYAELEAKR